MIDHTERVITKKIHELHFDSDNIVEIMRVLNTSGTGVGFADDFFKIYYAAPGEGVTIRWEE